MDLLLYGARMPNASRVLLEGCGHMSLMERPGETAGAKGLIVESSFTSLSELVSEMGYGWVPARMLLTQKFDSIDKIAGQLIFQVNRIHSAPRGTGSV